jgi:outer membrane protein OmpA-like peptidoglycan-associated protein
MPAVSLELNTKEDTLTLGEDFQVDVTGIMGTGLVWFETRSPKVCDVTSLGKVHPYTTGECSIVVAVAASGYYMDAYSEPKKFQIKASNIAPVPVVTVIPAATPITPKLVLMGSVYFTRSTSALDNKAYLALAKILTSLKSKENYSINLVGYSDVSKGLNNYALSLARSKTVASYLKKNKVAVKISNVGRAANQLVSNLRADDPLNRRVELWVVTS